MFMLSRHLPHGVCSRDMCNNPVYCLSPEAIDNASLMRAVQCSHTTEELYIDAIPFTDRTG